MSTNTNIEEYDGDVYGIAQSYNELTGNFNHDARGDVELIDGPPMVAEQLIRTLRTPIGDDPLRPEFGLDVYELLGHMDENDGRTKQAIIEAIGPDAFPWVEQLGPGDIVITKDGGNRYDTITVTATLEDGTPVKFSAGFTQLLTSAALDIVSARDERAERALLRRQQRIASGRRG